MRETRNFVAALQQRNVVPLLSLNRDSANFSQAKKFGSKLERSFSPIHAG
jgi:hypothetical protein